MDLTKLLKEQGQDVALERPQVSKEEYAAQKKAEREELWAHVDELTANAFRDGESLRGFLDFVAQCSPERIENLLLFYNDNPEITWVKTFDEWKAAGRGVRSGETGYTAFLGQEYEREDGTRASGYTIGRKFDVSQTRGRQPDKQPVYAADELVTALFTNSPVRLSVEENLPEGVQAQYVPRARTILIRNNMDAETTFMAIAREQAVASYDLHDGRYSRAAYGAQSYCAAYVLAKRYGIETSGFSFERVCEMCTNLDPQALRRFLSDAKQAAYSVDRTLRRGLSDLEQSLEPEPAYSMEAIKAAPDEKQVQMKDAVETPAKSGKKASAKERS